MWFRQVKTDCLGDSESSGSTKILFQFGVEQQAKVSFIGVTFFSRP